MENHDSYISNEDIEYLHRTFLLFGSADAPYWFLGLEEGDHPVVEEGSHTASEESVDTFIRGLLRKSKRFNEARSLSLRDLCVPKSGLKYLPEIEESGPRTSKGVKYQSTWGGYIKFLLSVEQVSKSNKWTLKDVKRYQKYDLGALSTTSSLPRSCLMELFPMARKGRKKTQWPYKTLSSRDDMAYLETPQSYKQYAEAKRVEILMSLVKKNEPKYLVCFGDDCKQAIISVVNQKPKNIEIDQGKKTINASTMVYGKTRIIFSNHPTSHGISNLYWKNLGSEIASLR